MAQRDFTVRITREGKIVFDVTGFPEHEVRNHREMAEEIFGPILADGGPTDPPDPGRVATTADERDPGRDRQRGRA